jgi:ClpP class serine protease
MGDLLSIFYVLIAAQLFVPLLQRQLLAMRRQGAMKELEKKRNSRVITLIHRQETMSLFGIPIARYIDVDDSERILRAIRMTPPDMPLDIVLHTPGGLVLASEQIANALKRRAGPVRILIPHYAMSGGTMIALASDEIVMDPGAVLGPVDPQLGSGPGQSYPAVSILRALEEPNPNRADETLIMGDMARKAMEQTFLSVRKLLQERLGPERATEVAHQLTDGQWTHDYAITPDHAREFGLNVSEDMPGEVYALMDLYEQPAEKNPSVEYIPAPYRSRPARPAPSPARSK